MLNFSSSFLPDFNDKSMIFATYEQLYGKKTPVQCFEFFDDGLNTKMGSTFGRYVIVL